MPNISRSKDNQTMKFGQLIEFKTRNNFLEKSYTKCGGETSPRHFSDKIKIDHISGYLRKLVSVLTKFGKRQTSVSTSTKDQSWIISEILIASKIWKQGANEHIYHLKTFSTNNTFLLQAILFSRTVMLKFLMNIWRNFLFALLLCFIGWHIFSNWIMIQDIKIFKTSNNLFQKIKYFVSFDLAIRLTLSWRRPISYRNQSIDLRSKSMDWFLYDIGLRNERVKIFSSKICIALGLWFANSLRNHYKQFLRISLYFVFPLLKLLMYFPPFPNKSLMFFQLTTTKVNIKKSDLSYT